MEQQAIENSNSWISYVEERYRIELYNEWMRQSENYILWGSPRQVGRTHAQQGIIERMQDQQREYNSVLNRINEYINYEVTHNNAIKEDLVNDLIYNNLLSSETPILDKDYHYPF